MFCKEKKKIEGFTGRQPLLLGQQQTLHGEQTGFGRAVKRDRLKTGAVGFINRNGEVVGWWRDS